MHFIGQFAIYGNWHAGCKVCVFVTGHGIARSTVHLERINMISRVQLSAFTLYCGLLGAFSLADPLSHNSTRSNRGTVDVVDAEAIEYALIAALIGDDSDIDWSISDAATCKKKTEEYGCRLRGCRVSALCVLKGNPISSSLWTKRI